MDARTGATGDSHDHDLEGLQIKRVRLLASLTLIGGIGLLLALPFALRAGAEFFLPVTAALVVAIALVPMLEWFERRGVPPKLASGLCVMVFLALAIFAIAAIVIPAIDWVALIPQRIDRVTEALAPLLDLYSNLEKFIDKTAARISIEADNARTVRVETPNSMLGIITASAPHAAIQLFFALLVIYFFLAGWTGMRKRTIVSRGSFEGALTTARVIQQTVDATSTYIGTITVINVCLGGLTAAILWALGMDSPLMWGGIVAVLNYIPYLGPIVAALLLALGGLMTFVDPWAALLPPGDLHCASPDRGQCNHADDRRQKADHQPAADPGFAVVLGLGVGHDGGAAGRAAADHFQDGFRRGGNARHRRIPVRGRNADPRRRRGRKRRVSLLTA